MTSTATHEQNFRTDPLFAPELLEGDVIMYDEPGRIIYRPKELARYEGEATDYRSHWYRLIKPRFGPWTLLVKHGGGTERVELGYDYNNFPAIFDPLTSDARYLLMNQLMLTHRAGQDNERAAVANRYKAAFVEGRLKKRKYPKQSTYKVWIEDKA